MGFKPRNRFVVVPDFSVPYGKSRSTSHGNAWPIDVLTETTREDAFEESVDRHLSLHFRPPFNIVRNRAVNQRGKSYQRPDVVVYMHTKAFLVAEAKYYKRLRSEHIDQVVGYREGLDAERAVILIPSHCQYSNSVEAYATENDVAIVVL